MNQLNEIEAKYALSQLLHRAGVRMSARGPDSLRSAPVRIIYAPAKDQVVSSNGGRSLIIHAAQHGEFEKLIGLKESQLDWVERKNLFPPAREIPISERIPILFPSAGAARNKRCITHTEHAVHIHFDPVAAAFFMLSRYEEYRSTAKDKYGRFPASKSVASIQGFLDQPIVDEYALILRSWMKYLSPGWEPELHTGKIMLSHDIDFIRTLPNMRKAARLIWKKRKSSSLLTSVQDVIRHWNNERKDPGASNYFKAVKMICDLSNKTGLESTFFFKASTPTFYDSGYNIRHPALKPLFQTIKNNGFSIGLHPSFHSFLNRKIMKREKIALESAIGQEVTECRQHYLRFKVPDTWKAQTRAGFLIDNSMAYAEIVGFRCGTCHPYHPFDIQTQSVLEITERPLIVMDSSLNDYMNLSLDQARNHIVGLAQRCVNVEGEFTLLWHNTSFFGQWSSWGNVYKSVLIKLSEMNS